jgi:hypothetical protein
MLFLKSFVLFLGSVLVYPKTVVFHDFHTSLTEMRRNASENSYEITVRVFTDDLVKALSTESSVDLYKENAEKAIEKYFKKHFAFVKGKEVRFASYIGKEVESDATWLYFELNGVKELREYQVLNSIFLELFDDQSNLLNIIKGEKRHTLIFNQNKKLQALPE